MRPVSQVEFINHLLAERFRVGSFYIPAEVRKQPKRKRAR